MTSFRREILIKAFMVLDLGVMAVTFIVAALSVPHRTATVSFTKFLSMRIKVQNIVVFLGLLLAWHVIFSIFGLYESKRLSDRKNEVKDVLKATFAGTLVILLAALLFRIRTVTPTFLATFWVLSSSIAICLRLVLRLVLGWLRVHGRNLRQMLIVGTNPRAVRFAQSIESRPELGYRLIGFVDEKWAGNKDFQETGYAVAVDFEHFPQFLREHVVDEVAIALPMKSFYPQAARIVAVCEEQGILVRFLSSIFSLRLAPAKSDTSEPEVVITVHKSPLEGWPVVIKRVLDVAISLAALIILSPLMWIVAALIKRDSPGPVFFRQERVGLNKRRFRIYKFRSMRAGAEKMQMGLEGRNEAGGPVFKINHDPRITRIGKVLRKTSLDELPQLFNVLKGDMSLVGPRPLPVRDYQGFDQDWQRRRFSVRPGITCLWQINGRSAVSFEHWMDLDMQYIDQWSLWLDMKILAKTIPAVLRGAGAA